MTAKGVKAYRKANPGSKLKTAVTGKLKKEAKRLKDVSLIALDLLDSLKEVQLKLGMILTQEYVKQDEGGSANGKRNKRRLLSQSKIKI